LGRSYVLLGTIHRGPRATHSEARKHLARALEIDEALPEGHTALGAIYLFLDWNWPAAEREFKQAMTSDSSVGIARSQYGLYLAAMGRLPEALAAIRQGQELDPLAAPRRNEFAMCYNWMRQYDQAITEAHKTLELDPNFINAYGESGRAYTQMGLYEEAFAELRKGLNLRAGDPRFRGLFGYAHAMAGQKAEARRVLEELKDAAQLQYGSAFAIARIHAALGEKDQAFEWLQKACDERYAAVIWIKVDPTLDNLRSDPRFDQLVQDMKLPP
jgi:tetratricopeptide (TPR) repeat protein